MKLDPIQTFGLYLDSIGNNGAGICEVVDILLISLRSGFFVDPSFFENYFKEDIIVVFNSMEDDNTVKKCDNFISRIDSLIDNYDNKGFSCSDQYYDHIDDDEKLEIITTILSEKQVRKDLALAKGLFKETRKNKSSLLEESVASENEISKIQFNLTTEMLAALFLVMWETSLITKPTKKVIEDEGKSEFARKAVLLFKTLHGRDIGYDYFYDSFSGRKANALSDIERLLDKMRLTSIRLMQDKDEDS